MGESYHCAGEVSRPGVGGRRRVCRRSVQSRTLKEKKSFEEKPGALGAGLLGAPSRLAGRTRNRHLRTSTFAKLFCSISRAQHLTTFTATTTITAPSIRPHQSPLVSQVEANLRSARRINRPLSGLDQGHSISTLTAISDLETLLPTHAHNNALSTTFRTLASEFGREEVLRHPRPTR